MYPLTKNIFLYSKATKQYKCNNIQVNHMIISPSLPTVAIAFDELELGIGEINWISLNYNYWRKT